ncbi:MAG: ABC transporter substrate-binding protein [Candidatus Hydrogenedentes bacterium]|nr:ABC transporter substrate-binding protein [Candidatus Hydrogenedentota bacterium]
MLMKNAILAMTMLVLAAGCGGPSSAPATQEGGAETLDIAVIPKGLTHQFWVTVRAGAEAAAAEMGAKVIWQGPTKETEIDRQINIMQDMINRGVDGIVMAACDENALATVVGQAGAAGIPVVTFDSGVKSEVPKSFVATDNVAGAKLAADTLSELMGGTGEVGLIPFVPGAATSELREKGFREGLLAHPGLTLAATNYCQSDIAIGMNVTTDMITAFPNLGGIFAANEPAAIGAAQALRGLGKAGAVKLVSFDASAEQIAALKEGVIQALVVQNPFKMGYEGVKAVISAVKGQEVPKVIDTGVTIVTKDNVDTPVVQALLSGKAPDAK